MTLQREGYRVLVAAPRDRYSPRFRDLGVEYRALPMDPKGTHPIRELRLLRRFVRLYRAERPDLTMHFTVKPNIYGALAAAWTKTPSLGTITGLGTLFLSTGLSSRIGQELYRLALRYPRKVFFLNESDRELFVARRLVEASRSGVIAGAGIDTDYYAPSESEKDREIFRFLMITRLIRDKGVREYYAACRELKKRYSHLRCTLLGDYYPGNPTAIAPEVIGEWESSGILEYLGNREDIRGELGQVEALVLPSYREGLSQVLLEGASMGVPLIASDVPGCREIVEDGVSGLLCTPRSPESLSDAMERMMSLSSKQRREMGKAGRRKVLTKFSVERINTVYLDEIRKVLLD